MGSPMSLCRIYRPTYHEQVIQTEPVLYCTLVPLLCTRASGTIGMARRPFNKGVYEVQETYWSRRQLNYINYNYNRLQPTTFPAVWYNPRYLCPSRLRGLRPCQPDGFISKHQTGMSKNGAPAHQDSTMENVHDWTQLANCIHVLVALVLPLKLPVPSAQHHVPLYSLLSSSLKLPVPSAQHHVPLYSLLSSP